MIIDCHVHISACTPENGEMSRALQNSLAFRFLRWRLKAKGYDANTERQLRDRLFDTLDQTPTLDAAAVLAFDAVYDCDGRLDGTNTHLHVKNNYVMALASRHRKVLFAASVHPYRKDAVVELERCIAAGAVLLKWLPVTQNFNPADERCMPIYEVLAHHKLPLLSHTGGERALPILNAAVADPMLLEPALKRGVTVIAAHCGTRSASHEPDYLPQFLWLAREYENCFGDTAALNLPSRSYAWETILRIPEVRAKLVHGSDWPIPAFPPVSQLGLAPSLRLMLDSNWLRRDVRIKQDLGLGPDYWHRAARLLRLREADSKPPADRALPATESPQTAAPGHG
jgi:predicted TIM-barrel fold metal-dependent hydrolase